MSCDVLNLFETGRMVKVCAPMVRYSKLPFRSLVRKYDCDLCFTPMILADSFIQSSFARNSEFSTNSGDKPLIVQFAARDPEDFSAAAEMVAQSSNGVDLNCGCPQRWAMKDGYGASLLNQPELIRDIVLQVRNRIPHPFTVSVKIRILEDIRRSVELCQNMEATGVSFITIHSRTPQQRHQPISIDALKLLRGSVGLPLIANGDVKTLEGAMELYNETGCQGVMSARGILNNPALFAGYQNTPVECVKQWVEIATNFGVSFTSLHHHLQFMMEKILPKKERLFFTDLKSTESVLRFLEDYFGFCFNNLEDNAESSVETCEHLNLDNVPYAAVDRRSRKTSNSEDYMGDSFMIFQ